MNKSLKKTIVMDLRKINMSLVILFVQNEITLEFLKWGKKETKSNT